MAVSSHDGDSVFIESKSSPYNQITTEPFPNKNFEKVQTVCLSTILRNIGTEVDLLKIDCEGMELEILKSTKRELLNRIKEIRLEFHEKYYYKNELFNLLEELGYRKIHSKYCIAWFKLNSIEK